MRPTELVARCAPFETPSTGDRFTAVLAALRSLFSRGLLKNRDSARTADAVAVSHGQSLDGDTRCAHSLLWSPWFCR